MRSAKYEMAEQVVINAKTQRPSVCNAAESLLIHNDWFAQHGKTIIQNLENAGIEIIGDETVCEVLPSATLATDEDYATEYLSLTMSVKVVDNVFEAIDHINTYGTNHSEAIITEDVICAERFLNSVDAAAFIIMHPHALQMVLNLDMVQKLVLVRKNYMRADQWDYLPLHQRNIIFTEQAKHEDKISKQD